MYRLLLVDDESEIREGLIEVIDFNSFGFEVAGEASNGLEAVQAAERLKPDLIITDIRMPLLDGLSMCRQVQKALPATCFIILSGYDDFEYARQAIQLNCLGYMLKPISAQEFRDMLQSAKRKLDEAFAQRRNIDLLKEHFEKSLPLLKEALLNSLIWGGIAPKEAALLAKRYQMDVSAPQYVLAFISVTQSESSREIIGDQELLNVAAQDIAAQCLEPCGENHLFHYNGVLTALLPLKTGGDAAFFQCVEHLSQIHRTIDHYLKTRTFIGVSAPVTGLSQLPGAARQARAALDQCAMWNDEQLLCITDLEPSPRQELYAGDTDLRALSNALKLGQLSKAQEVLDRLLCACREVKPAQKAYRAYLMEIYMALIRTAREMNLDLDILSFDGDLEQIIACPPPDAAGHILLRVCRRLHESAGESRASFSRTVSDQATQYMAAHYEDEDLTVEKLCTALHISPSYFSVLFKKETKKTFLQTLTELRMDKAMALLTGSDMKTAQIARAVGLPDPSYFSYCFKKHFGVSPSQARKGEKMPHAQ